jgi:hypothetical protein
MARRVGPGVNAVKRTGRRRRRMALLVAALLSVVGPTRGPGVGASEPGAPEALGPQETWDLARENSGELRFSVTMAPQALAGEQPGGEVAGDAIDWCKRNGFTHVYLRTFGSGRQADAETLVRAKERLAQAEITSSGLVVTTDLGRRSSMGWLFPCFTEPATQDKLRSVFEFSAGLFDEIIIDDFLATRCLCDDCLAARGERSWSEYRRDLLVDLSDRCILQPARAANPGVSIILKYPQWYDEFHFKGYDVARQTEMFDEVRAGTETREPDDYRWKRVPQYEAYYNLRWVTSIAGDKCRGGWFDPFGTTPPTFLEQARQTVLAGASEVILVSHRALQSEQGRADMDALHGEMPDLFRLAALVRGKPVRGVAAPKPPNSEPGRDRYIYDFLGMLGLPLVPCPGIDADEPALLLTYHSLTDPELDEKLAARLEGRAPTLVTDNLAVSLPAELRRRLALRQILPIPPDPWELMEIPRDRLDDARRMLLEPLGVQFAAPTRVALYLFGADTAVVENFNDEQVPVSLGLGAGRTPQVVLTMPAEPVELAAADGVASVTIAARSLVALEFRAK